VEWENYEEGTFLRFRGDRIEANWEN